MCVHSLQPLLSVLRAKQTLDRLDAGSRVVCDLDEAHFAIRSYHIANRGRYHSPAGGEILRRFRRTDEACRVVTRERHHRNVPSGKIMREVRVRATTEVMDIR